MNNTPEQFFSSAQEVSLTPAEKTDMYREILSCSDMPVDDPLLERFFVPARGMCLTPAEKSEVWHALAEAPMDEATASDISSVISPLQSVSLGSQEMREVWQTIRARAALGTTGTRRGGFFHLLMGLRMVPALAAVLVLLTGAGVSYAAGSALPGDPLYFVKKMNEEIRRGLHLSTESRAEAEAELLGTRLREAEALEARKGLTQDVSITIDQEFRRERRSALNNIESLETAGNSEAAARIRAKLNAYQDGYDRLFRGRRQEESSSSVRSYPTIKDPAAAQGSVDAGVFQRSSSISSAARGTATTPLTIVNTSSAESSSAGVTQPRAVEAPEVRGKAKGVTDVSVPAVPR